MMVAMTEENFLLRPGAGRNAAWQQDAVWKWDAVRQQEAAGCLLKSIETLFVRAKCESIVDSTFDSAIPANLAAVSWPRCSAVRQVSDAVRQH